MYKFIKEPPNEDVFSRDTTRIEMSVNDPDITWSDLLQEFKHFLLACGFSFQDPQDVNERFKEEI